MIAKTRFPISKHRIKSDPGCGQGTIGEPLPMQQCYRVSCPLDELEEKGKKGEREREREQVQKADNWIDRLEQRASPTSAGKEPGEENEVKKRI